MKHHVATQVVHLLRQLERDPETQRRRDAMWLAEQKKPNRLFWSVIDAIPCITYWMLYIVFFPFPLCLYALYLVNRFIIWTEPALRWICWLWLVTFLYALPASTIIRVLWYENWLHEPLLVCPASYGDMDFTPRQLHLALLAHEAMSMVIPFGYNGTHFYNKGASS